MSGQGVGKFEQSFLSGHHGAPACLHTWGATIAQSCNCILLTITFFVFVCLCLVQTSPGGPFWPQQPPTKAIPMLSVWIRGTGLRAHVEPFGDRGNDDGDMYNRAHREIKNQNKDSHTWIFIGNWILNLICFLQFFDLSTPSAISFFVLFTREKCPK